ncbi:MAG: ABC transporter ATP-binding protein, partial [Candidatus Granulicatella sp. P6S_S16_bin.50.1]|nr:ABC transporter ATP-binding protein [Candidatus Granulicatella sp. P6S_S16_bin.50.1]
TKMEEPKVEAPKASPSKKMTYQEKKEWETIEGTIQELEERLEFLQEEMSVHAQDFAKLQELQEELDKTEEAASAAYERWEYLAELAGN